jgi:D-glycero-alpha-D-manno-heptose 1-phosphate guanylyltransferase
MEAIVLAGGLGTRLRAVVPDLPKPMAPVSGRPFLEILLTMLAARRFERVVLSLGHLADKVVKHFGTTFAGMDLVYEIEQAPLGTGGALRVAIARARSDHVFVINGDTFLDLEFEAVEAQWQRERLPIIAVKEVADASRYGRLNVSDGFVTGFVEKGAAGGGLINAGYYVFPTDIAAELPARDTFSLERDFLQPAVPTRHIRVFESRGRFVDIGVPEDFSRAQVELAEVER